jgi:hypothetical protein
MREKCDPDGLKMLAVGVVEQAIADWRYILERADDLTDKKKRHTFSECNKRFVLCLDDLETFFRSEQCRILCQGVHPDIIITQLEKERLEAIERGPKHNRRERVSRRFVIYNGETISVSALSKMFNIDYDTLRVRLNRGMSVEEAVNRKRHKKAIKEPAKEEKGG